MQVQSGECFHILDEVLRIEDELWIVGNYLKHCVDDELISDKKISYIKTETSDDKLEFIIFLRVLSLIHKANHEYFSLPPIHSSSATLRFVFMDIENNIMKECRYRIHRDLHTSKVSLELIQC